ncbi:hypothetical protein Pcinc_032166 [Petrolisthes cinctipes]|uniref:4-coumarate--CoA ligase n=1 Tax=Petrolisthes cinctipes TaxID=88211 RepID=A0AAE1EV57_PETCI|nr:hypothetical protein Pcinc_036575 [Petrolisthes cinctipes]KAK3861920.1 hypothetical protein Pcinc_032166 [Petrolisthes cinctipes]
MVMMGSEKEDHIHKCQWEDVGPVPKESFAEYMINRIAQHGDKAALIDGVSGEAMSYNELNSMIRKLSHGWKAAGLTADEVVCVVTPNCILAPPTFLAAAAISAPVTFANPLYTPGELRRHITHSKARWVIGHPACLPSVQEATKDLEDIKGLYVLGNNAVDGIEPVTSLQQEAPIDWAPSGVSGEGLVLLPYSSGTTGLPKGVELSSFNWLAVLSTSGRTEYLNLSSDDVILGILPFFHTFGIGLCLSSITHGATMVTLPRFIPNIYLTAIQNYKVTYVPLVPPLAIFMAKHDLVSKFDLTHVKSIVCGAAPLAGEVQDLLSNRFSGVTVRQGFGMTETTLACFTGDTKTAGAVGQVAPHCEAKIVDMETGDSLGPNKDGELCVRGPIITKGYLNNPEATSTLIDAEGWLHTGDVGRYSENGIFYIVDRIKELIKYKGFQVAPAELEGLLVTHEAVGDVAVVGIVNEEAGELPRAYVVPKPGCTVDPEELVAWVQERVAPHKKLRGGVEIIDAVPRSPSGKILRRLIREKANAS